MELHHSLLIRSDGSIRIPFLILVLKRQSSIKWITVSAKPDKSDPGPSFTRPVQPWTFTLFMHAIDNLKLFAHNVDVNMQTNPTAALSDPEEFRPKNNNSHW